MIRQNRLAMSFAVLACLSTTPAEAAEATMGYRVQLRVPVMCMLQHGDGPVASTDNGGGGAYALGTLGEYCNSPDGYELLIDYTPGSMKGAVIMVGEDRIQLNGSGEDVLRVNGPRIRVRSLSAIPGPAGFDTAQLNFNIQAA